MHEFSIGENLVRVVLDELGRLSPAEGQPAPRLLKARVVCGCLQGIVPESLQFAYEVLTKGTPAQGSALEVVSAPATCVCRECGWQGVVAAPLMVCGACGGAEVTIVSGKQLHLECLEIDA